MVATFFGVTSLTVALSVPVLAHAVATGSELVAFGVLLTLALVQAELSRRVERVRRWIGDVPHVNVTSVWTFAGALLLPAWLAAALAVTVYTHLWLRIWSGMVHRPLHRVVFSASMIVLSCYAASAVLSATGAGRLSHDWAERSGNGAALAGAALAFALVNAGLALLGSWAVTGRSTASVLFAVDGDYGLELATLCLGGLVAAAYVFQPCLVAFVFMPLFAMHRAVLARGLELAAATDQKTGLLNAAAWHNMAAAELGRARRDNSAFGLLMVDLDHFKRVNDTYGHLAGDAVLIAVATAIRAEVRDYDSVGRFGGEEFSVLLPGISETDVVATAERIRHRVTTLSVEAPTELGRATIESLSASIGVAVYPHGGGDLEKLLLTADTALYKAKNTGRNKVVSLAA
ncbi:GGDEF domain-containing protein [Kutzneria viridogrisea]